MNRFGFGNTPAASPCGSALQTAVMARHKAAAAAFWSPSRTLEVMDEARPPNGLPVSTFNTQHFAGLGVANADVPGTRWTPAFCGSVKAKLAELKWLLDKATQSTAVVQRAQTVYNELDGIKLYTPGGSDCANDAATLTTVIEALRAELAAQGAPGVPSTSLTNNLAPPGDMDPTLKFAIIGGIVVAGIIGVAYITGQVGSVVRAFKRVV